MNADFMGVSGERQEEEKRKRSQVCQGVFSVL